MAKKASVTKAAGERASWKGQLNFGLVSFAVEAFNALNRQKSDVHFHQLHAKCHSRIHNQKVCPVHGEVPNDEIVSGYEVSKGKYVEFDPEELDKLRTDSEKALSIDAFVPPETIDPLYFDGRMYYLLPANTGSHEAFSVVVTAMEKEGQYGVGRIVMSGKDQIVLLRPMDGLLHMAMLNYSAEIRPAAEMKVTKAKAGKDQAKQLKIAQSLIQQWTDDNFDFAQYKDDYKERVEKLIASKVKGRKIEAPKEETEEPVTLNLMEALQKSLAKSGTPKKKSSTSRKSRSA